MILLQIALFPVLLPTIGYIPIAPRDEEPSESDEDPPTPTATPGKDANLL